MFFANIVKKDRHQSHSMVYGHGKALDNRRRTRTQGDQYSLHVISHFGFSRYIAFAMYQLKKTFAMYLDMA
jgi:hypothetical protein